MHMARQCAMFSPGAWNLRLSLCHRCFLQTLSFTFFDLCLPLIHITEAQFIAVTLRLQRLYIDFSTGPAIVTSQPARPILNV